QGSGVTLTATGGSLGTGANYQWGTGTIVGTNPIAGAASSTFSVTPSSTTSYWVSVTGPSPCNGAGGTSTTVTVATPSTAVTGITGGGGTVCQGSGVILTATGGSLGAGASYLWGTGPTVGTNSIAGATSSTYSVTPSSTTSYWVSVTGPSPCNGAGGVSTTVTVATPSTAVTGISGATAICSGTGTTLTATGGSLGTGANYQWGTGTTVGTNPISGATSSTYSVTPVSTTSYWVSVTGPSPCNGAGGVSTTVTTISATANAALATSSVNGVTLSEQCTDNNGWTYYADPSAPGSWLFGVYKNGNSFTPSVTLTVNSNPTETRNDALKKATYTLDRYWNVTISGSISASQPVKVRFFYSPSDTVAMRSAAASRAAAYGLSTSNINGLEWFKTTAGIAFDPANNTYSDVPNKMLPSVSYGSLNSISYVEYQGLTSFSGGTAGMRLSPTGVALPVQLMYLTATAVDNSYLRLDWATASEINNRGFEIQRSTDGISYETIGWVDGHGNSNTKIDYSYDDKTVIPNSIYYYRLRQLDFDGKDDYSNIVSGTIIGRNGFVVESLRPNPASSKVTVQVVSSAGQSATVSLTDALGRELQTREWEIYEGFNGIDLDLTPYAAGTYTIVVRSQNSYFTRKLVINR
ncbi:MAG: T9SS type A sorting domain-containing protein, partial [Bacteroidetes bacterium]|nr:T9SS type A sorting domain-containing protein [Bacteroidota bacterium]